jgi:hypothetical protein
LRDQDRAGDYCRNGSSTTLAKIIHDQMGQSKHRRVEKPLTRDFDWLAEKQINHKPLGELILRAIVLTDTYASVWSDGGKRYRHMLPVQQCKADMIDTINEMLYYNLEN